jgi:hypothetical protein
VAVPTEEHALSGLLSGPLETAAQATGGESERLLRGVEVMEVQSGRQSVVSARSAAAAGLLDEDALDPTSSFRDPFLRAENAPIGAATI